MVDMTALPSLIIVMGVCGCGKSTLGRALAKRLNYNFLEGDEMHPPENVAWMKQGRPLTDEMRAPWLDTLGARLAEAENPMIASCSSLRRNYRDRLRTSVGIPLVFVHLRLDSGILDERLASRGGHFMPPSLVASQLATLEPLEADESGIMIEGDLPLDNLTQLTLDRLSECLSRP